METNTTKVIGYVRVSTDEQAADGHSLAVQRDKIAAWHSLHAEDAELIVFGDEGITGKTLDRPGLQQAIEAASAEGAALVVYSLSRLSRTTKHTLELAEQLEGAGANLVSLSERIDTTTAAGKMVFRMLAVLAEFERDVISERTTAALQRLRDTGQRFTRDEPYSQRVSERCAELRDRGLSWSQIAQRMTREGYPTRRGGPWHRQTVRKLVLDYQSGRSRRPVK